MPEIYSAKNQHNRESKETRDVVVPEAKKLYEEIGEGSLLGSISVLPKNVTFGTQHDGEKLIVLLRAHIFTNLKWIALVSLLTFLPLFWGDFPLISALDVWTQMIVAVVWYLALGFVAIENLMLWYYSVYIITDERLIDVDFFDLFYKNIDVTRIKSVENVNYSQMGALSSILNYGDVVVETSAEQRTTDPGSGERATFTFEAVPNPDRVARVISELIDQEEQEALEGRLR